MEICFKNYNKRAFLNDLQCFVYHRLLKINLGLIFNLTNVTFCGEILTWNVIYKRYKCIIQLFYDVCSMPKQSETLCHLQSSPLSSVLIDGNLFAFVVFFISSHILNPCSGYRVHKQNVNTDNQLQWLQLSSFFYLLCQLSDHRNLHSNKTALFFSINLWTMIHFCLVTCHKFLQLQICLQIPTQPYSSHFIERNITAVYTTAAQVVNSISL